MPYQLPGPKSAELIAMSQQYEPGCTSQQAPIVWESGEGCIVRDVDGNEYIDWTSGVLVANVGHCHPHHVKAIQDAVARLMNPYDFPTPERVTLAKRLVESMPPSARNLNTAFLLTTGSEATEAAMRVAKRFTGKHEMLSFWGGFHGRTWGAMSLAGKMGTKKQWGPLMPGCLYSPYAYCYRCPFELKPESCDFACQAWMDRVVDTTSTGDLAAVILEPYQGGAGFIFPPDGWLTRVQEWCREREVLFIVDEVQASFGRTGKLFCIEHEGLTPNMLCLGKGIGSGIPTAALMAERRIMESLPPGDMSSTTGGNPVSCAAGHAVLDIMESENLVANSAAVGAHMLGRFKEMVERFNVLGDARGKGLVIGLEFVTDSATKEPAPDLTMEVIRRMCQEGVVCGRVGIFGNVIRVAPPLVITMEQADRSVDTLERVLKSL
jgi:4-aminobutyrate aminotransferase